MKHSIVLNDMFIHRTQCQLTNRLRNREQAWLFINPTDFTANFDYFNLYTDSTVFFVILNVRLWFPTSLGVESLRLHGISSICRVPALSPTAKRCCLSIKKRKGKEIQYFARDGDEKTPDGNRGIMITFFFS